METVTAPLPERKSINWITFTAFAVFHIGAIAAFFFFSWTAFLDRLCAELGRAELGNRNGLSSPAHASWLQMLESVRVLHRDLRNSFPGRRTDFLGRYSPHPSSDVRQAWRSAQPARWRLVGAHSVDGDRRRLSQQDGIDGALCSRSGSRSFLPLAEHVSLGSADDAWA